MTRTTKFAFVLLLLAALAPAYAQRSDRAKRVGDRMWCMCGCNQILTQCNHVGCSTSTAMLKKLDTLVERNEPDDLLIQSFVQEYGAGVLAQHEAKGLALMGYAMPAVALLGGLAIVFVVIQHWRRGTPASEPAAGEARVSADQLERARRRADAETNDEWGGS
jgi:cytochrome c-type biogenesis protein CcmH/NrfF